MADYWKSQPRKFCQYCKCWIADNKPSIEFHERGKNHKENVAAKISEIKKKSVDKAKQEQRMCKQFAAMEEAAMKAYEEDLKRMEREAAFGPEAETTSTTSTYKPVPLVRPQKQPQASREESKQESKQKKAPKKNTHPRPPRLQTQPAGAVVWVEGKTDDGYTYYYNTVTGESRWDKPDGFQGETSHPAQSENTGISAGSAWTEAISPEGYTYYYNTETGESSWEKPADYSSNEIPESDQQGENQEEPPNTAEEEKEAGDEEEVNNDQPSKEETEVTEEVTQQSTVPKINFRKRKAEANPSEETSESLDETPTESDETPTESGGENKQEEDSTTTVPEEGGEEEKREEPPTGRFRPLNPYGTWERIKVQKDPYASVDWQLPKVEGGEATTSTEIPPEPKHKFKTRVITSLGESTGPATFKKKKTQNGKSRSLRQRDDDD